MFPDDGPDDFDDNDWATASSSLNYNYLSRPQFVSAATVAMSSALLSMYGSAAALYLILRNQKLKELYHRLIFGLCVSDLLFSASIVVHFVGLPSDLGLPMAVGSAQTCNALAFFFQYYMASSMYNALLSLYFCAKIVGRQTDRQLSARFEPMVHVIPFGLATVFAVVGVSLGLFHVGFTLHTCDYWAYYPPSSVNHDDGNNGNNDDNGNGPERGIYNDRDNVALNVVASAVSTVHGVSAVVGVGGTWIVYRTVKSQLQRMQVYRFATATATATPERQGMVATGATTTGTGGHDPNTPNLPSISRSLSDSQEDAMAPQQRQRQQQSSLPSRLVSASREPVSMTFSLFSGHGSTAAQRHDNHHAINGTYHERHLRRQEERHQRRNQIVMMQAILYTAAFLNGFVIVIVAWTLEEVTLRQDDPEQALADNPWYTLILFLCYLFFPLQGLFNFLIYVRLRLVRIKRRHPTKSWWWSYRHLFASSQRQRHSNNNSSVGTSGPSSTVRPVAVTVPHRGRLQDVRTNPHSSPKSSYASSSSASSSSASEMEDSTSWDEAEALDTDDFMAATDDQSAGLLLLDDGGVPTVAEKKGNDANADDDHDDVDCEPQTCWTASTRDMPVDQEIDTNQNGSRDNG